MAEGNQMLEVLARDIQAVRDKTDEARKRAEEAIASVADERKSREASISRLHDRLDEVSNKVSNVYQVLLLALIPIASGLLLAIIGYMLKK